VCLKKLRDEGIKINKVDLNKWRDRYLGRWSRR